MTRGTFNALPTVVGSFPQADARRWVDHIFERLPDVPAWPQLPGRDWHENMYIQYSEGLPGAVLDDKEQRIYFSTGGAFQEQLEAFYQAVIEEDVARFGISPDYAQGLHVFMEKARERGNGGQKWLKGHITGPFSFAMTVVDESKRSLAYNPELNDVASQGIALKARWIARKLREICENVIVSIDEPYLCSYGSAFVNVSREEVVAAITNAMDAVHKEGALAGLHCCGNTDWSLALETPVDILNFDAYGYFEGLPLYPAEVKAFLERGGTLSWGIVPTSDAIKEVTADSLLEQLEQKIDQLAGKGIDRARLVRQSLITPSCGLASQSPEVAERALELLGELSAKFRARENL